MWLGLLDVADITRMKVYGSRVAPRIKEVHRFKLRNETTSYNAVLSAALDQPVFRVFSSSGWPVQLLDRSAEPYQ
jgi:hypothetical protein